MISEGCLTALCEHPDGLITCKHFEVMREPWSISLYVTVLDLFNLRRKLWKKALWQYLHGNYLHGNFGCQDEDTRSIFSWYRIWVRALVWRQPNFKSLPNHFLVRFTKLHFSFFILQSAEGNNTYYLAYHLKGWWGNAHHQACHTWQRSS